MVRLQLYMQSPNFESFEVNINAHGWKDSGDVVEWKLSPSGISRIEMRTRNQFGVVGKPSHMEVLWNFQAPYTPKPAALGL